jgi:aldose 1-epimerase
VLDSADGDQGYPGRLRAKLTYGLPEPGCLRMDFETVADQRCPVSLTSHAYFNLDGDARSVAGHVLRVQAEQYLPLDAASIPTGEFAPVAGTPFDLRRFRLLREALAPLGAPPRGYDHCFVLDALRDAQASPVAELVSSDGQVALQLFTNYPGLQVYSGQHLAESKGRDGKALAARSGIALEAQHFPDAPNRPEWPDHGAVLEPGLVRRDFIAYRFSARS